MKNILKFLTFAAVVCTVAVSCDYDDTNFDLLTNDPDPNATYYIQFKDASKSLQTGVSVAGDLVDIETTVSVGLLGLPLSQDIQVNFAVDPSTTIEPSMYELSATSITIPAGAAGGSVTFKTITENMPVGEALKFVLNVDAGANTATAGTKLSYDLLRIEFCPWTVDDMVGTYSGNEFDGYYGVDVPGNFTVSKVDDTHIAISNLGQSLYAGSWGEAVTSGNVPVFEYLPNGKLVLANQYNCTTDLVWDYYIGPGAEGITWDGCNMAFYIPWKFHFSSDYDNNFNFLTEITKN